MEPRGNYFVKPIRSIGNGAFGQVEEIELYNSSGHLCGKYARKVLSVQDQLISEFFDYDDWRRRFEREVKYQADCSHVNVVPIYIHHLNTEHPWFVMDLAEKDLKTDIRSGRLSDEEKLKIIRMILCGVSYVHDKGYFHRDLKPENILKFSDGKYKISDFGLVKNSNKEAESEVLTRIAVGMGTDGYMAPEAKKGIYNAKTDIYALGVIINELGISHIDGIDEMIAKATSFKPNGRYESVSEMVIDIDIVIGGVQL